MPIPAANVHRVEAERADAAEAAALYAREIARAFALSPGEWPRFDLILLGMGPDGHTASLFPGTDALLVRDRTVAATWVAKFGADRITLTLPVFDAAAAVHFLVSGADKAQTLRAVFDPALRARRVSLSAHPAGRGRASLAGGSRGRWGASNALIRCLSAKSAPADSAGPRRRDLRNVNRR